MVCLYSSWTSREDRTPLRSQTLVGWQVRTLLWVSLGGVCGWPLAPAMATEAVPAGQTLGTAANPSALLLTDVPPEAKHVAPSLQDAIEVFHAALEAQRAMKQLRAEQDDAQTRLAAVTGELALLAHDLDPSGDEIP